MHVFVTGASGHIGSAVVPELLGAGHKVTGLARSGESAAALEAAGVQAYRGSLDDLDGLREAAAAADGVIHLAFKHEAVYTGDFEGAAAADRGAVEAMAGALAGTGKPLVIASGTLTLAMAGLGRAGTEDDVAAGGNPRTDTENMVIALAERDVRSAAVRLAPTVHSSLDRHGFVPALIGIARRTGVAGYAGDGSNRWPAVHTLDAAALFRLAVEAARPGSRLHAVGDEGVPFREIAGAIGRHLGVPVAGIPADELAGHFGFLAGLVGLDNPTSAALTRRWLGWRPVHAGLIADLDEGHYFTT